MELCWVTPSGVEPHPVDDLAPLLGRPEGFVWLDVPTCHDQASSVLADAFGFHPLAVACCQTRNYVPRVHLYPDHFFMILHAPEEGEDGHVHLIELDQFCGLRYLVTTHGPWAEGVAPEVVLREVAAIRARMDAGRFRPSSPAELSHALGSGIAQRQEQLLGRVSAKIAALERQVMGGELRNPEAALEEMFRLRHQLLTVRTMAAECREVYARVRGLGRFLPEEAVPFVEDGLDRFERVRSQADGEREFLQGVIDYYESRTATKINIAMERLALIAALVLPLNALAAIYGMNIIVNESTDARHVIFVLAVMAVVSGFILRWTRRQGWW